MTCKEKFDEAKTERCRLELILSPLEIPVASSRNSKEIIGIDHECQLQHLLRLEGLLCLA